VFLYSSATITCGCVQIHFCVCVCVCVCVRERERACFCPLLLCGGYGSRLLKIIGLFRRISSF